MNIKHLLFLIFFITGCGSLTKNNASFVVSLNEIKTHRESGLKINLSTSNVAAVLSTARWLFSSEDSERKAKDMYELAKTMGLDAVLSCVLTLPDGTTQNMDISKNAAPFCFSNNGKNYLIQIIDVEKVNEITITFDIQPTTQSCLQSHYDPIETENVREKYKYDDNYLNAGETFNDEKTGLHVYLRETYEDEQAVLIDIRLPNAAANLLNRKISIADPIRFSFENRNYSFKVTSLEGRYCEMEVREL